MSSIRAHRDRTRGPEARTAAKQRRAQRQARERLANMAERALLALIEGQAR